MMMTYIPKVSFFLADAAAGHCGSRLQASALVRADYIMFQIAHRFTFVDVFVEGEKRGQDVRAGRAQSAPPPDVGEVISQDEHATATSPGMTPQTFSGTAVDSTLDLPEPEAYRPPPSPSGSETDEESDTRTHLSAGSIGHPVLCKRPCVHIASGRLCAAGTDCDFCHLPHNRVSWLDKQHRHTFQAISKVDFLLVTLRLLKQKARDAELSARGSEALFGILERELQSEDQGNANTVLPSRIVHHLRRSSFWVACKLPESGWTVKNMVSGLFKLP